MANAADYKRRDQARRREIKRLTAEHRQALDALEATIGERDTHKTRADELQGKQTAASHREAFNAAALKAGVDKGRLDDAWALSGYKPEGNVDAESIAKAVKSTLKGRQYLIASKGDDEGDDDDTNEEPKPPPKKTADAPEKPLPKGEGHGRGPKGDLKASTVKDRVDSDFAATGRKDSFKI
jgi:hypothetical protein